MMETLRVQLPKEKARKVRETAMKRFGYSKGAISKAITNALDDWMKKQKKITSKPKPDWNALTGIIKEIKIDSVKLQHFAFEFKTKKYS